MQQELVILYAEDNEDDVMLVRAASRRAVLPVALQIVSHGDDAIAYLSGDGDYGDRQRYPLPRMVLLDLKMPRRSGLEVLQWIRAQPAFKFLPVVMFTSSLERSDQERCYSAGCNSFLIKPANLEDLLTMFGVMAHYWLKWNEAPARRQDLAENQSPDRHRRSGRHRRYRLLPIIPELFPPDLQQPSCARASPDAGFPGSPLKDHGYCRFINEARRGRPVFAKRTSPRGIRWARGGPYP